MKIYRKHITIAFIKNIEHEKVFAFSKGEEIGTHDSTGDAMVHVLEGTGKFTVGGKEHI